LANLVSEFFRHYNDKYIAMDTDPNNDTGGTENTINLPEHCAKKDPAGTDPNRYGYFASADDKKPKDSEGDNDYDKEPKNHTTTKERLINPDRGE
jgi:hypothetical protein